MPTDKLGFGLIGARTISRERMIGAMRESGVAEPVTVMSRNPARASSFAAEQTILRAYDRLDAMLADTEAAAIYVASTNEQHHPEVLPWRRHRIVHRQGWRALARVGARSAAVGRNRPVRPRPRAASLLTCVRHGPHST